MRLTTAIPVLRLFDEERTRIFYRDYLGFNIDWEHRFEADFPLYLQISRDGCVLHLSGHHGDGTPGTVVRIGVEDLETYHGELTAKNHPNARPSIEMKPWGLREFELHDSSGNRLIFHST